jgi:hypothetical protein
MLIPCILDAASTKEDQVNLRDILFVNWFGASHQCLPSHQEMVISMHREICHGRQYFREAVLQCGFPVLDTP